MDLKDLLDLTDKAYDNCQVVRERAADDSVFYWVTQWDDAVLSGTDLAYRGEFNILRKAGRQVMADLRANPVQVDFEPVDETRDDAADVLDGLYRADDRRNSSQEAYTNAQQEAVVCGVGAWELYADYVTAKGGNKNQVIKRAPILEANNVVFWDPNSTMMDKSDARYVCILTPYTKDSYKSLVEDLTGEEDYEVAASNFKFPQESYTYPWVSGDIDRIYVGTIYYRKKVKDAVYTMVEALTGEIVEYYESDLMDKMDDLIETGYTITAKKDIERWEVTKYIASGERILDEAVIACEYIPVVPVYGERAFVEGQEIWEGITRLAKDPSRLRNFIYSYIADIASKSPRPKPIFSAEQIQGYEAMYANNGADNNYPYYLQNTKTANGEDLPLGPLQVMPEQQVPTSVMALAQMTRESVDDVTGYTMPKDFVDSDLSGNALAQIGARIDQQSHVYQENMKHSKRRDAEIYASMASRIYDVPREVITVMPDGTRRDATIMKQTIDKDTGEIVILNDLRNAQFDVYSEIGPSYQSQKDKLRTELTTQIQVMPPDDPMRQFFMLKYAELMDGTDTKDIREYAKKQLLLGGYKEPDSPEEAQMIAQAQEANDKPDPMMVAAQAEMAKAEAAKMREQNNQISIAVDAEKKKADTSVDIYNAQTSRFKAETEAQKAGADIQIKKADMIGKQYQQVANALRSSVNQPVYQ